MKSLFRTSNGRSLIYFAASSFSQSESVSVKLIDSQSIFTSNTQSDMSNCVFSLSTSSNFNDNKWHSLKIYRKNSFAFISSDTSSGVRNSTGCRNQVITDVTGVYIGGLPPSMITGSKLINLKINKFLGCLKKLSTIIELDSTNSAINPGVDLNFKDAVEYSSDESTFSNVNFGCPVNLETGNGSISFLGFGFLTMNVIQTLPLSLQSSSSFIFQLFLRTEFSMGLIFFNFDLSNNQYLLLRLVKNNSLQINYKSKIKYNDPDFNDPSVFIFIDLNFNQTFYLGDIDNGYWFDLSVQFNFIDRTLAIYVNQTQKAFAYLISELTLKPEVYSKVQNFDLIINFYLDTKFHLAGFNQSFIEKFLNSDYRRWSTTQEYYIPLFKFLSSLNDELYFSGCIKMFRVNGFLIEWNNLDNVINYRNIRLNYFIR